MSKKYGVLIKFFNDTDELHGIYNSFEEAKSTINGFLKFIAEKYNWPDMDLFNSYVPNNTKQFELNFVEIDPSVEMDKDFPVKFKVIPGVSGRFIDKNKSNKSKETAFERKYRNAQKVAVLINSIYLEKDKEKKRQLIENSLIICQKSRHHIRSYPEIIEYLDDVKKILKPYKGGFINEDAEKYFLTKIVPFFQEYGDEDYVYFLDKFK